jgi:DNA-binding transcriptional MerR regulator
MVEFLEFINAPKQFYIARDLQLAFPLEELSKLLKKCRSDEEADDIKNAAFTNILMQTSSDMGRFIRNFKSIIGSDYQEEFLEEQEREIEEFRKKHNIK